MPKQKNTAQKSLINLSDYFYYVLLLAFLAMPFFAAYRMLQQPTDILVSTPGATVDLAIVPAAGSETVAPNDPATFELKAKASEGTVTVSAVSVGILVPNTVVVNQGDVDFVGAFRSMQAKNALVNEPEVNPGKKQLAITVADVPGSEFNVDLGTNWSTVATFILKSDTAGEYPVEFRTVWSTDGDNTVVNEAEEIVTGDLSNSVLTVGTPSSVTPTPPVATPTVVPTPPTGVTPTPPTGVTPTPPVATPTVVPTPPTGVTPTPPVATPTQPPVGDYSDLQGLILSVDLGVREAGSARAMAHPNVFVGVWRPSSQTLLTNVHTDTNAQGQGQANLANFFSQINSNPATQLNGQDIIIVKPEGYLSKAFVVSNMSISGANLVIPAGDKYQAGDPVVDLGTFDIVNVRDYAFARSYFGGTRNLTYWAYFLDFNGDSNITVRDFVAYTPNGGLGQAGSTKDLGVELVKQMESAMRNNLYKVVNK